jgi:hypothetical protein
LDIVKETQNLFMMIVLGCLFGQNLDKIPTVMQTYNGVDTEVKLGEAI